jgi:hypothetical protein
MESSETPLVVGKSCTGLYLGLAVYLLLYITPPALLFTAVFNRAVHSKPVDTSAHVGDGVMDVAVSTDVFMSSGGKQMKSRHWMNTFLTLLTHRSFVVRAATGTIIGVGIFFGMWAASLAWLPERDSGK